MRRLAWLTPALATLTACTLEPELVMDHVATLPGATHGLVLRSDGHATAAMDDQVCLLDTRTGEVLGDMNPSVGQERLLDARGDVALAATETHLTWLPRTTMTKQSPVTLAVHARDAKLTDHGAVVLLQQPQGCALAWTEGPVLSTAFLLDEVSCEGATLTADPDGSRAWVADGLGVVSITADGAFTAWTHIAPTELAYVPATDTLLAWHRDDALLGALSRDGDLLWIRTLTGAPRSISPSADAGTVAVSTTTALGGDLLVADVLTGGTLGTHPLPEAPLVALSDSGDTLALSTPDSVYFYAVDPAAEPWDSPAVIPAERSDKWASRATGAAIVGTAASIAIVMAD